MSYCEEDEYFLDEANDDKCIKCYTIHPRCIICTSATECTKCSSGYITTNKSACVNDCY